MRSALLPLAAFAALASATPAMAAPSNSQRDMERVADRLNDPATQAAMSGALTSLMGAFLDMRIDGFAKALEPLNGGRRIRLRGNTLRDVAANSDRNFEARMNNGSRAMIGSMGALAGAMATMVPELEAAMERVDAAMDRASRSQRDAD